MKLLMISGDRSVLQGKMGAFWYTLQELRKHWDRIDIICPRVPNASIGITESGHRFKGAEEKGGEVFFHPCPQSLVFQVPWIVRKGKHLIEEQEHDVMTVHDFAPFYNGIGARKLHKKTGVPFALEIHHIVGWPKAASIAEWIGRTMSPHCIAKHARSAAGVRVVNTTVQDQLIRWGVDASKIHLISSFYLDKQALSTAHKPPVSYDVAFCARLVANKGLTELIAAVAGMPDVRLLVIGDGPESSKATAQVQKLNIENRVTFLGWLPTQEGVSGAMQTARIFVMNSKSEGGPRVALEAMACGLPIIATPVGVMPEVIRDGQNGVLTDGSVEDLKQKIGFLLLNEEYRESLGTAAKEVLQKYERGQLIKEYADFLKHLS